MPDATTLDQQPLVLVVERERVITAVTASGGQGPPGPPGIGGAAISAEPNNRLTQKPDGLYVADDLAPDPLAFYILAKA